MSPLQLLHKCNPDNLARDEENCNFLWIQTTHPPRITLDFTSRPTKNFNRNEQQFFVVITPTFFLNDQQFLLALLKIPPINYMYSLLSCSQFPKSQFPKSQFPKSQFPKSNFPSPNFPSPNFPSPKTAPYSPERRTAWTLVPPHPPPLPLRRTDRGCTGTEPSSSSPTSPLECLVCGGLSRHSSLRSSWNY